MASIISAGTTAGTALNMTGDTTGNLAFQTAAGANTITVPNGTGTMVVNGVNSPLVSGTTQNSTSGTSIDFTGIPSWVKRITVIFNQVSTSGTSNIQLQIGSGSVQTTGYSSVSVVMSTGVANTGVVSTGMVIYDGLAASSYSMHIVFTLVSGNTWVSSHYGMKDTVSAVNGGGTVSLSGALDRVRVTTINGTDTFDAGSINIQYE
jgi:hypothetical protein